MDLIYGFLYAQKLDWSVINFSLMDVEEKIANMVIPKPGLGGDGKISWESYSRRRGYRRKEVQEHMEKIAPYLEKHMEI